MASWQRPSSSQAARRTDHRRALAALPTEQREVIVMKIWGGLTFKGIGNVLRISPNTAASRYRYALEALRSHLSAEVPA